MMHKKTNFLILLLLLFPAITRCMEIEKPIIPIKLKSLYIKNLKCKREVLKSELELRHGAALIRGWSVAASAFFYSLYTVKNNADFDKAIMARGEFYIPLYCKEQIEECSALGIITIAEQLTFSEKKELIQQLCTYNFVPTLKDKELAVLERWERSCNQMVLHYAARKNKKSPLYKLRSKFIRKIFSFMVDLEELLF